MSIDEAIERSIWILCEKSGLEIEEGIRGVRQTLEANGFFIVPREPTQQQVTQGYQFLLADSAKNGYGDRTDSEKMERMRGYYRTMVDASANRS